MFASIGVGVHVALAGIGVVIRWHWYSLASVIAGVGVLVRLVFIGFKIKRWVLLAAKYLSRDFNFKAGS